MRQLVIAMCLLSGCNRADGDRLARVGKQVAANVRAIVPERTPFGGTNGLPKIDDVNARVRERFKTDRFLTAEAIEVIGEKGAIRLKGTVSDESLKTRAVEMAESTVGVESVNDEIAVEK